jgi:hypothetical protein
MVAHDHRIVVLVPLSQCSAKHSVSRTVHVCVPTWNGGRLLLCQAHWKELTNLNHWILKNVMFWKLDLFTSTWKSRRHVICWGPLETSAPVSSVWAYLFIIGVISVTGVVCNGPQANDRLDVAALPDRLRSSHPFTWDWKHPVFKILCSLKHQMMDKVQKLSNRDCYTPSEPSRIV